MHKKDFPFHTASESSRQEDGKKEFCFTTSPKMSIFTSCGLMTELACTDRIRGKKNSHLATLVVDSKGILHSSREM